MGKFNGFGGGGGSMQQLMKQAQKMQEEMLKAQEELDEMKIEGTAGGGLVTVLVSGKKEFLAIEIKPEAVDPEDVEMLEDLIRAAMNDATTKANEVYAQKMAKFGGMGF